MGMEKLWQKLLLAEPDRDGAAPRGDSAAEQELQHAWLSITAAGGTPG